LWALLTGTPAARALRLGPLFRVPARACSEKVDRLFRQEHALIIKSGAISCRSLYQVIGKRSVAALDLSLSVHEQHMIDKSRHRRNPSGAMS
jgi:hypothetical protein